MCRHNKESKYAPCVKKETNKTPLNTSSLVLEFLTDTA
jgi:hypothetical protein